MMFEVSILTYTNINSIYLSTDDTNNTVNRKHMMMDCALNNIKLNNDSEQILPHCWATDKNNSVIQFGHVDPSNNRSFVLMESCTEKVNNTMIYSRSSLQRQNDAGEQLALDDIQLRVNQPDDIAHNTITHLLDTMSAEVIEEIKTALNEPIKPDELSTAAWSSLPTDAVRSYDAWDAFLWNVHKFGIEYLAYDAPRVVPRLVPIVERLRNALKVVGPLDLYTGYWGRVQVPSTIDEAGKMVEVPKYLWLVATNNVDSPLVYVVPNGPISVDLCTNLCDHPVHCCAVSDISRQVKILNTLF